MTTRLRRIVAEILDGDHTTGAETLLERVRERAPELAFMRLLEEFERDVLMEASRYLALEANATVRAARMANPRGACLLANYAREVRVPASGHLGTGLVRAAPGWIRERRPRWRPSKTCLRSFSFPY